MDYIVSQNNLEFNKQFVRENYPELNKQFVRENKNDLQFVQENKLS